MWICFSGEFDTTNCAKIREIFTIALEIGCKALQLDMSEVSFIGSATLRELLTALRLAAKAQVQVTAVAISPVTRRLLDLADLDLFNDQSQTGDIHKPPAGRLKARRSRHLKAAVEAAMSTDSVILHEDSLCRIEKSTNPSGLTLYGRLDDGETRSILERALDNALRDGHDLYVDLSHLKFIDVACMRTLMDAATYLRLDGCRLLLLGPNPTVRRIIAICQETGPRNVEVIPRPT